MANGNEITVTIQGDSAQLVKALEKAEKSLENFGNSAEKMADSMSGIKSGLVNFAALTESFENVYSAVSSIGQSLINTFVAVGDELDKMADRTNISVENLSKLKYAAEMSGSGFETVIDGLKTFNEQLGAARLGDVGAIGKLGAVGIKAENFAGLDEHSAFLKLANHIASIKDSAIQTRTAIELFGDAGYQLLPFFQQGEEGIKALCQEADTLGFTFSEKDAKSAAELKKNIDTLKSTFVSMGQKIMEILAGPLNMVLEWTKIAVQAIGAVIEKTSFITKGMAAFAAGLAGLIILWPKLVIGVTSFCSALTALNPALLGAAAAFAALVVTIDAYVQSIGEAERITSDFLDQQAKPHQERFRKFENRMNTAREGVQQGLDAAQTWRSEDDVKRKEEEEAALPEHVKELQALNEQLETRRKVLNEAEKGLKILLKNSAIDEQDAFRRKEKLAEERDYLNLWYRENLAKIEAKKLAEEIAESERQKAEATQKAAEAAQKEAEAKKKAADEAKKAQKEAEEARKKREETAKRLEDAKDEAEEIRSPEAIALEEAKGRLLLSQDNLRIAEANPPEREGKSKRQIKDEEKEHQEKVKAIRKEVAKYEKKVQDAAIDEQNSSLDRARDEMVNRWNLFYRNKQVNPNWSASQKAEHEENQNQRWKDYLEAKQDYENRLNSISAPMFNAAEVSSRGTFSAFGLDSVMGADVQKEQLDNLKKICSAVLGLYEKAQGETVVKPAH